MYRILMCCFNTYTTFVVISLFFLVPKVKSEGENSGLQPKTHVDNVKDSNIEPSNPNEKV